MYKIYEYIYPTTNGQTIFTPANSLSGTSITIFKNGDSATSRIIKEIPGGMINGNNRIFNLSYQPVFGTEEVYLNGRLLKYGGGLDYTLESNILTMNYPPASADLDNNIAADILLVSYRYTTELKDEKDVTTSLTITETPSGLKNGINKTYMLSYIPLKNLESIYKNNILLEIDKDYTIDNKTLNMTTALLISDVISATYKYSTDMYYRVNTITNTIDIKNSSLVTNDYLVIYTASNKLSVTGDYGDVIYKRYGSQSRLMNNQKYFGTVTINNDISIDFNFTSRYNPFYCPTKLVKEDIQHIVDISNESINFAIYDASRKVYMEMSSGENSTIKMPTPYELSNLKTIPYNIQQYVRYTAEYDILIAAYNVMAGRSGSINKRLGDLSIEKNIKLPDIDEFLRGVKEKLQRFDLTTRAVAKSFIKGNVTEPYPISPIRRSF